MMLLVLHILVASGGLVLSSLALLKPTRQKLSASKLLVGLTLFSGFVLAGLSGSGLMPACLSGLVYLAVCLPAIYFGHIKLQKEIK